ncbi:MAG: DsbA family protein [Nitrosopumilaceae archaeon]
MKDSKFFILILALSALIIMPYLNVNAMKMSDSMMEDIESKMQESVMNYIDSPHKQTKMGVADHDIQCKVDYTLVFKSTDWSPACVKESSVASLVQRGWAASEEEMMSMEKEMMKDESMMEDKEHMDEKSMMTNSLDGVDISTASPAEGSLDTDVTIIEFGDYQCPKCDQWFKNEKPSVTSTFINTNKVKLYFIDFAFLGEDSIKAAEATYCSDDQGKYWDYHAALYNNQGGIQVAGQAQMR